MIADLDETIKQLLVKDMPIKNGEIDVKFDQPKREWSAKLTKPTVNFFLYDVRENADLRQAHFQKVSNGNVRENLAAMKKNHCAAGIWSTVRLPQKNRKLYSNQFFLILIQVKIIEKPDVLRVTVQP